MRKRQNAFTLIEMMIVIVVIAILIVVLLPQFRGTQDEASIQRARSELRTLATAIESFYIHNSNALPANLTALITVTPRIISTVPDDPFRTGSTDYTYLVNGQYYVITSWGVDRLQNITAISAGGVLTGSGDDICVTNGTPAGTSTC